MKILYIKSEHQKTAAVVFYRQIQILEWLRDRGHEIVELPEDMIGWRNALIDADVLWLLMPTGKYILNALARITKTNIMECKMCAGMDNKQKEVYRKQGNSTKPLRILMDFDDDIFSSLPTSPYYVDQGRKENEFWRNSKTYDLPKGKVVFDIKRNVERLYSRLEILKFADIVSSPSIRILKRLKRFAKNADGVYFPNAIDTNYFKQMKKSTVMYPWIKEAQLKYPNLDLITMGTCLGEPDGRRWTHISWAEGVRNYAEVVSSLTADFAIAHVNDDTFNRFKSPLRACEMMTMGLPVLCSRTLYGEFIDGNVALGIYNNKQEFMDGIDKFMKNPADMKVLSTRAQAWAEGFFGIKFLGPYIESTLFSLVNRPLYRVDDLFEPDGKALLLRH